MGSLVNSTKHLREKSYQFSITSLRRQKHMEYFLTDSIDQHFLIPKLDKDIIRKLQTKLYFNKIT